MVRRSVLFSPGDPPQLLRKAPETDADVVVFDLEDAVSPGRKAEAREAVRDVLSARGFDPDAEVCIRVNPGETAARDIEAVCDGDVRLDAVVVPKVAGVDDLERITSLLTDAGLDVPLLALIESAAGVLAAESIAAAPATDAVVLGAEDLAADVGATRTDEGTEVLHAREHLVLAAGAADVDVIDTVYTDFEDEEGLREETEFARTLGFDGKLAIHPAQVPIINDAFTPDPADVEWARKVLAAREEADANERGVFAVDGEMIDPPLLAQAERIIERAEAANNL